MNEKTTNSIPTPKAADEQLGRTEAAGLGTVVSSQHVMAYEADTGIFRFAQNGTMTEADALELINRISQSGFGDAFFVLGDHRNATTTTAGARKAFTQFDLANDVYFAAFGASFAFRSIITMVFKAVSVMLPRFVGVVFSEEAEARAWLREKQGAQGAVRAATT